MSRILGATLPVNWSTTRLKSVVRYLSRGTAPDYVDQGNVRAISQAANQDGQLDWTRTRFHKLEGPPSKLRGYLRAGDILVNSTGTGTLGRVGFFEGAPDGIPCMADSHVTIVRTDDTAAYSRYAYYWLRSQQFQDYIYSALAVGATNQIELNREGLANAPFPLPHLEEQRRIADFLDVETSRIDNLIYTKSKFINQLDERRVALADQLCLRGTSSESTLKNSGIDPIGEIPSHWRVLRNKNFIREVDELSKTGMEELLTVSHITGVTPRKDKIVYMFEAESKEGYKICRPGDLVINTLWAWMGALGVSSHFGIVSPAYGVYRLSPFEAVPDYFDYLYRTPAYVAEMTRHSKGVWTSRLRLYPENFLALRAPVPPIKEQKQIVAILDKELESDRRIQSATRRSITLLAERRQALITAAVTGQFDVSTASDRGVTE